MGLKLIRVKLPEYLQHKWRRNGQHLQRLNSSSHPPFSYSISFLKEQALQRLNTNYDLLSRDGNFKTSKVLQTNVVPADTASAACSNAQIKAISEVTSSRFSPSYDSALLQKPKSIDPVTQESSREFCAFHQKSGHSISQCQAFMKHCFEDRKKFAYSEGLCFRCLGKHRVADCSEQVSCDICGKAHATALHRYLPDSKSSHSYSSKVGGKDDRNREQSHSSKKTSFNEFSISINYIKLCNDELKQRQCSKTVLVDIMMEDIPDKKLRAYCIIDEQSSVSLIDDRVLVFFDKKDFPSINYTASFASQKMYLSCEGLQVTGLRVQGFMM